MTPVSNIQDLNVLLLWITNAVLKHSDVNTILCLYIYIYISISNNRNKI